MIGEDTEAGPHILTITLSDGEYEEKFTIQVFVVAAPQEEEEPIFVPVTIMKVLRDPQIIIESVSSSGLVTLRFNQTMEIPTDFLEKVNQTAVQLFISSPSEESDPQGIRRLQED